METKYITIRFQSKADRKERAVAAGRIARAVAGAAGLIGIAALLIGAGRESKPVSVKAASAWPMEVYTTSAADLWAEESRNPVNPSPLTDSEWTTLLEVCQERNIDVSLALGLIWTESRFDPDAVSPSGCYGLCQINPRWHPSGLSPEENIRYGLNYLADQCQRYDSVEAGLTSYNAGRDTGSRRYANAVFAAAKEWEVKGNDSNH